MEKHKWQVAVVQTNKFDASNFVSYIRILRFAFDLTLKDAKDYIDRLRDRGIVSFTIAHASKDTIWKSWKIAKAAGPNCQYADHLQLELGDLIKEDLGCSAAIAEPTTKKLEPLYKRLANLIVAIKNCKDAGNDEWEHKHAAHLVSLVEKYLPSGSGFDNGTTLDMVLSSDLLLRFRTAFHHMNDNGMYIYWTEHVINVKPNLACGFGLHISGNNKRNIKEHIHDVFYNCLSEEVEV